MQKTISLFIFFISFLVGSEAQTFVQLEVFNSTKTIKYAPGQKIVYKTKALPDEWQKQKIESILYEDNIIVFPRGMVEIDEITHIKTRNPLAYSLSRMLYVFAGSALIFGGIGDLVQQQLSPGLFLYTLGPAGLGFFLDKVVTTKVYYLNKNSRLRLLDLRVFD